MRNLRNAMLVAVVAAAALAAIAGFFLGGPPTRLLVDAGLAIALAVIVGVMLSPTVARTEALVEALRALARGDKHQRVDPNNFAGLAEVARAMNEVAASLTEGEDPNLGPIKATPRPKSRRESAPRPELLADGREIVERSDHPEIGPVRVMKKKEPVPLASGKNGETTKGAAAASLSGPSPKAPPAQTAPTPTAPTPTATATSSSSSSSAGAEAAGNESVPGRSSGVFAPYAEESGPTAAGADARSGAERPVSAAPGNDTNIDSAPRSDIDSGAVSEPPHIPSRADLEVLFQEFVAAKKSHEEAVADLDFDAFAQTIQGECERLIAAHRCRGVRFEITMQDGEVSLRPRLLR